MAKQRFDCKRVKSIIIHDSERFGNRINIHASGRYLSGTRFKHIKTTMSLSTYRDLQLTVLS